VSVLVSECASLYAALSSGKESSLAELPIQYADYAIWQRAQTAAFEEQLTFWRERLAGAPAALELPTDRRRPIQQTFEGGYAPVRIGAEVTARLKALGQSTSSTLFMVLLGGFQVLLSRYSGQSDVVVGTPIANRRHAELEGLVGMFVNTLAMRLDLSGNPSFRELLARVRDGALGAYAHQDLPFERLVDALSLPRDPARSPVFQARSGSSWALDLERRPRRRVVRLILNRRRPVLPGAKLITYRTKGSLQEHENLVPSAGSETPGKPTSPTTSRPRGGASVVVRARESRVHGEGRQ
jgi:hypothetical protein